MNTTDTANSTGSPDRHAQETPMTNTTPPPLTTDQLQEYRDSDLGEWYEGPWTQDYVEAQGDDPAHNRVVHHETGTVLATLPDFAGPIALWIAVAREAHPVLLAETERLRAEQERVLRIVSETVVEANDVGGIDLNDLVDRLAAAGFALPDTETDGAS